MHGKDRPINWRLWAQRQFVEIHEFARLACGVQPGTKEDDIDPDNRATVREIQDLASRSVGKDLRYRAPLAEYVKWIEQYGVELPRELMEAVKKYSPPPATPASDIQGSASTVTLSPGLEEDAPQTKAAATKARKSMLTLIGGMAAAKYGFQFSPLEGQYEVARRIEAELQSRGISVSDQTIAKYLEEAAPLLRNPKMPR